MQEEPTPPFAKGGGRRPGDFPPKPRALRKGKSSVSFADSSFCERSLFPHKRNPRPLSQKGVAPQGRGIFSFAKTAAPQGRGIFSFAKAAAP